MIDILEKIHKVAWFYFILFIAIFVLGQNSYVWAEFPSPELLKELQSRLLEKPDCLPGCAEIQEMELKIDQDSLKIMLTVHAASETFLPLPGSIRSWSPHEVMAGSIKSQSLVHQNDGTLWILISAGIHQISLRGPSPEKNSFDLPLALRPRHSSIISNGWDVQGLRPRGQTESSLQFTRKEQKADEKNLDATVMISPFFHVERRLILGFEWQVQTTLSRITALGTALNISVPLLNGESVITPGIRVMNKKALITMGPNQSRKKWNSSLKISNQIELKAPESVNWTETWILDANTMWRSEFSGIPVIHHQDKKGQWRPTWKAWPGESVKIMISRPDPLKGQNITIDSASLEWTPGLRLQKGILELSLRTNQGGQHVIELPNEAKIQNMLIDGKTQAIRQGESRVIIPLKPGTQNVKLQWHESSKAFPLTHSPIVKIGQDAVNAHIIFKMPKNRWILWTNGPDLGPAVLLWGYVIVIIFVSFGLGKIGFIPLKSYQWLLLGLGLTQIHPAGAVMIAGWFFALGLRKKSPVSESWFAFNATQFILIVWTIAAMAALCYSIQNGLLGIPKMQIAGNGSSHFYLRWTQDRIGQFMPRPWTFSVPLFAYRFVMLAWAFWLVWALLGWLGWAWECFSSNGIWKKAVWRKNLSVTKL